MISPLTPPSSPVRLRQHSGSALSGGCVRHLSKNDRAAPLKPFGDSAFPSSYPPPLYLSGSVQASVSLSWRPPKKPCSDPVERVFSVPLQQMQRAPSLQFVLLKPPQPRCHRQRRRRCLTASRPAPPLSFRTSINLPRCSSVDGYVSVYEAGRVYDKRDYAFADPGDAHTVFSRMRRRRSAGSVGGIRVGCELWELWV